MNRYGQIRFAQVPERVSTKSFVVLIIGKSRSNHLGAGAPLTHFKPSIKTGLMQSLTGARHGLVAKGSG